MVAKGARVFRIPREAIRYNHVPVGVDTSHLILPNFPSFANSMYTLYSIINFHRPHTTDLYLLLRSWGLLSDNLRTTDLCRVVLYKQLYPDRLGATPFARICRGA